MPRRCLAVLVALLAPLADVPSAGAAAAVPKALHVSPAGSDRAPCTVRRPCRSFDRAYHRARPGQIVRVHGGRYPQQRITPRRREPAKNIVFRPALGARPVIDGLELTGSRVTFERLTIDGDWLSHQSAHHLIFRDVVVRGAFFINSSSHVRIVGGSVGPAVDKHAQIGAWPIGTYPHDILIDGVRFHDFRRTSESVHIECLQIGAGVRIVVRRSRFLRCDVFALFFTEYNGPGPPREIVVENNVFGASGSGGFYSLAFNSAVNWSGVSVRHNSAFQAMLLTDPDSGSSVSDFEVTANVAPVGPRQCDARVTSSFNVWGRGSRCGKGDRIAPPRFRDPARGDARLRRRSAAIDHADPERYPATDVDGRRRPLGKGPDAGAVESR